AYLSWLIHLVGDIHQPLHTVSWFGGQFTEGDKGGNIFFVKPASRGINLHSLWDGLLGTSGKPQAHVNYAIQILAEHSRKSLGEIEEHKTPNKWSLEGRSIAIDRAYLRGELKGGTSSDTARALPDGYTKAAKTVAEKQGALAAYRLGDEIVTALGR
ncbi:MAG TPA: S1/P1 nuclease, partial [Candidatus Dormibacteraeota bacterium]|nr:S1/P1 nuclease [Candidatus Dormibacteraeota bacterium]